MPSDWLSKVKRPFYALLMSQKFCRSIMFSLLLRCQPTDADDSFLISSNRWLQFSVALLVDSDDGAIHFVGTVPAVFQLVAPVRQRDAVAAVAAELVIATLKSKLGL